MFNVKSYAASSEFCTFLKTRLKLGMLTRLRLGMFHVSCSAIRVIFVPEDSISDIKDSRLGCLLGRLCMLRLRKMGFLEDLKVEEKERLSWKVELMLYR